jgi:hypothetical protein
MKASKESTAAVKKYRKPPSQRMIETLKRCYKYDTGEIKEPCGFNDVKHSLAALVSRGLIRTDTVKIGGKEVTGFFVTPEGAELIRKYDHAEER